MGYPTPKLVTSWVRGGGNPNPSLFFIKLCVHVFFFLGFCGDSRLWCGYYLVTTRDVLSFVQRRQIRSKPSPRVCLFLVDTVWIVAMLSEPSGDEQLMLSSAVCLVQEAIGTSGAVVVVPSLAISSSCARDCVFTTRDMLCIVPQENLMCPCRHTDFVISLFFIY